MSRQEFESALGNYVQSRPEDDKQHLRITDVKAKSSRPMILQDDVSLGKKFFRGTPRLLRSDINILPCHPTADQRIALETY